MKEKFTKWRKLLFPPVWLMLILAIFSAAALVTIFLKSMDSHPIAYVIYVLSAYTVTVICIFCAKTFPGYYEQIKQKVYAHPLGYRYMTDAAFKVETSLYISLAINLAYAALKLTMGIVHSSFWLGAVAVYYILLSALRFFLLHYMHAAHEKQNRLNEYCLLRLCGVLLLILNLALSAIVLQMVRDNQGYSYPGSLIFVVGAYTFYTVTRSIIDIVKYQKYKSPVLSASKTIRFAEALVSLLSLETAMLAQFSDDAAYRFMMVAMTGAGVCLIVLGTSIVMIVQANKEIRKITAPKEEHK